MVVRDRRKMSQKQSEEEDGVVRTKVVLAGDKTA